MANKVRIRAFLHWGKAAYEVQYKLLGLIWHNPYVDENGLPFWFYDISEARAAKKEYENKHKKLGVLE